MQSVPLQISHADWPACSAVDRGLATDCANGTLIEAAAAVVIGDVIVSFDRFATFHSRWPLLVQKTSDSIAISANCALIFRYDKLFVTALGICS